MQVKKICLVCKKEFLTARFHHNIQKFCSMKCQQKFNRAKNYEKYKERNRINRKKKETEIREILYRLIGRKCAVCGTEQCVHFHEIHGKEHQFTFQYYLDNAKDFITLCYPCHKTIHWYAVIKNELTEKLVSILLEGSN